MIGEPTQGYLRVRRVQRGIELIEVTEGPEWTERIEWHLLDMKSCEYCILGQLFGSYSTGLNRLSIEESEASGYGFDVVATEVPGELGLAWRTFHP